MEIYNKKTSINRVVTILILCVLVCMAATIRLLKLSGWVYAVVALVQSIDFARSNRSNSGNYQKPILNYQEIIITTLHQSKRRYSLLTNLRF